MSFLANAYLNAGVWLANATPSPSPSYGSYTGDPDLISPGWIGFAITFLVALATVFLVVDMTRRIRRTRYREEIRARLEAESKTDGTPPAS